MKTESDIKVVFLATLARLPQYVDQQHVTLCARNATKGLLRVSHTGHLVGEHGHGVCGWISRESGQAYTREIGAVQRAMRAAMRVHP